MICTIKYPSFTSLIPHSDLVQRAVAVGVNLLHRKRYHAAILLLKREGLPRLELSLKVEVRVFCMLEYHILVAVEVIIIAIDIVCKFIAFINIYAKQVFR